MPWRKDKEGGWFHLLSLQGQFSQGKILTQSSTPFLVSSPSTDFSGSSCYLGWKEVTIYIGYRLQDDVVGNWKSWQRGERPSIDSKRKTARLSHLNFISVIGYALKWNERDGNLYSHLDTVIASLCVYEEVFLSQKMTESPAQPSPYSS